jgi:hypothetical protein
MAKKWFTALLMALWFVATMPSNLLAQEVSTQQAADEQKAKEKAEEQAVALLEQVIAEAAALRLPENRLRVQIAAADLLWTRNEERARGLVDLAVASLLEMMAKQPTGNANNRNNRQNFNPVNQQATRLREELILTVAQHDSTLAYQLLQTTRPQASPNDSPNGRFANAEASLEQSLLAQIARTDPQAALKTAEEMLEKGQYPNSLAQVLMQLQVKDKEAAAKLSERLVKRLQTENLLAKQDAGFLVLTLLRQGPRPAASSSDSGKSAAANPLQVLNETSFSSLLETLVMAALKANPAQGAPNGFGGRPGGFPNSGASPQQDAAQMEQAIARMLMSSLQSLLPQIDKYLPTRSTAVRQKLAQMGVNDDQRASMNQMSEVVRQGNSESILSAAATAPNYMQPMLYQQAATKALSEGNLERARQIANEHLDSAQRSSVLQSIETQQLARKASDNSMENIRQALARLPADEDRVKMLIQLSGSTQKANPKLALQILEEAQKFVGGRASNYQQFTLQLEVAKAFAAQDPVRSFELLEPGINQLNELFPAAALLSGFDVNIFKDGELPLQEGSRLASMVTEYGEQLAELAKADFERARVTADKFQLLEARIFTRLTIARQLLGGKEASGNIRLGNRRGNANPPPVRRQP